MEQLEPNHARDRMFGGNAPMELSYSPTADDFRRWILADTERVVRAEAERLDQHRDE